MRERTGRELKIEICVATHNRKKITISCIESVQLASEDEWEVLWIIVDASSTDGTVDAIKNLGLNGKIVQAGASSYWSRSMNLAMSMVGEDTDYVLLLNDDVQLSRDVFTRFSSEVQKHPHAILVGQTIDPLSGMLSYGGLLRLGRHPLRLNRVFAHSEEIEVDTFNGNVVLIPRSVIQKVGLIDARFEHAYGDLDYGFRAKSNDIQMIAIPGFLGTCTMNHVPPQEKMTRFEKLGHMLTIKNLPWRSQLRFTKRYGGAYWLVYFFAPYLKVILSNKMPSRIKNLYKKY